MTAEFPPGLLLIVGAILVPFIKGNLRSVYMLVLPLLGILQLMALEPGTFGTMSAYGVELTHVRIDKLSLLFGYILYLSGLRHLVRMAQRRPSGTDFRPCPCRRSHWRCLRRRLDYLVLLLGSDGDFIRRHNLGWKNKPVSRCRISISDHPNIIGHTAVDGCGYAFQ